MTTGRELMLSRIRRALQDVPDDEPHSWSPLQDPDPAASYTRAGETNRESLIRLFTARCSDYRANVVCCEDSGQSIAEAVHQACSRRGARSVVHPPGLPPAWLPVAPPARMDEPPLALAELDRPGLAALTGCALAIALTGTIVLDGGDTQGRRALTLVPDVHICLVAAGQIVFGVPEAIEVLGRGVREAGRPLTLVSGPSATSDIELERVEGVHGPRQLDVIVAPSG